MSASLTTPNAVRDITLFRDYILARETIRQKRLAGEPGPWSDDPVFQNNRFCNVYREDDRTTVWFRENVRKRAAVMGLGKTLQEARMYDLRAALLFRWFNRIETGELLFNSPEPPGWELILSRTSAQIDTALSKCEVLLQTQRVDRKLPVVTGSYCVLSAPNMPKLQGVLKFVDMAWESGVLEQVVSTPVSKQMSLRELWLNLQGLHGLGGFMAYEVVTDMRWTNQFNHAPDILTWANPGPGAVRGLAKLFRNYTGGREITGEHKVPMPQMQLEMQGLRQYLTNELGHLSMFSRGFELRDVEHGLCELDKYTRVVDGQGAPRGSFNARLAGPLTGLV